ncbi:MAG TPA: FAD-binding oxidoreductase [Hyphomicrobium sp.]|nr:FAD-binding oxidoreductase [Hyphomicrobium sp.]
MTERALSDDVIARFREIVGDAHALTAPDDQAGYLREWRDRYVGKAALVLRPASTDEVSRILALANSLGIGVVPQGGNTGLVGGQIPSQRGDQVVLSLSRMKSVRDVDADGGAMVVEAGVTLADAQAVAEKAQRLFPLSLASEGSAQIGGVLASNAGGTAVLAYGNARNLCFGLEVVLADGRVWNGLRTLKKDNTGYDLRDLMIGSEGTLGVITAAVLKLLPRPACTATAILGLKSPEDALKVFRLAEQAACGALTAFEFWTRRALDFALASLPNSRDPLRDKHLWYILIEVSCSDGGGSASGLLENVLHAALQDDIIEDASVAISTKQARDFWRLRESFSEAQKSAGGSIKHDISVPISAIPEFLERAAVVVEAICPGARPVPFGHFGDGNLHYNVSQPEGLSTEGEDKARFLDLWTEMSDAIHALVTTMNGSISAEHGIGQMKRAALVQHKSAVEIDLMRAIKTALDPKGVLNPGKVL